MGGGGRPNTKSGGPFIYLFDIGPTRHYRLQFWPSRVNHPTSTLASAISEPAAAGSI